MTADVGDKERFLTIVIAAIRDGTFIRLVLGKFRGAGEASKGVATLVMIRGAPHLKVVTSYARKDETKNFDVAGVRTYLDALIGETYLSATLKASDRDWTLTYSRKRQPHLVAGKPTQKAAEPAAHDRAKSYLVAADRPYLKALAVSDAEGRIKPTMQGKYRQICHFIEIVDSLLPDAEHKTDRPLSVVDIGSGKGYLTFALYDHLTTTLDRACSMIGIEARADLVDSCNALSNELGFSGLRFVATQARQAVRQDIDMVVALHACDTATDDAMAFGIANSARLILAAPCCQHELAPQLDAPVEGWKGLVKYPLFKQRQADLVTDAARALLLEAAGYKVKVIEFVSTEHTSKNILIAAVKSARVNRALAREQYDDLKAASGFARHHLASLLKDVE